jgi:hypothetical protein
MVVVVVVGRIVVVVGRGTVVVGAGIVVVVEGGQSGAEQGFEVAGFVAEQKTSETETPSLRLQTTERVCVPLVPQAFALQALQLPTDQS